MRFSHGIMGNPLCGAAFKQTLHSFAFCSQVLVCDGSARLWCGRANDGEALAWQKHRQKNTNHTDWFTAASLYGVVSKSSCSQQSDHVDATDGLRWSCSWKQRTESSRLKTSTNHTYVAFVRFIHTLSTFMRWRSSCYMYKRGVSPQGWWWCELWWPPTSRLPSETNPQPTKRISSVKTYFPDTISGSRAETGIMTEFLVFEREVFFKVSLTNLRKSFMFGSFYIEKLD